MIDKLNSLFRGYKEQIFGIKDGEIVFSNVSADQMVRSAGIALRADEIFPDEVIERCGREFAVTCKIMGECMDIVGSAIDDIGVLRLYSKPAPSDEELELLRGINIQLRESLSVLSLSSGFLADSIEKSGAKDMEGNISIILHSYYKLVRLSENISYITEHPVNGSLNYKNTDITRLVGNMVDTTENLISKTDVQIAFEGMREPRIVALDEDKFARLVLNLISNSLKYTEAGGKITVSIESAKGKMILGVKDTGKGLPLHMIHADVDKIRAFKSGGDSRSGLGLGLFTAADIAKRHDGMLLVESKDGAGTTVKVTIPDKMLESDIVREHGYSPDNSIHTIYRELADVLPSEVYSTKYLN